jgi:membrane-associated protein
MEWLSQIIDFFVHLDDHVAQMISQYGAWTYGILFVVVFCETGLVITPFLPGDSLLFMVGVFSNMGDEGLNPLLGGTLIVVAAVLGDNVNYHLGRLFGPRAFRKEEARFFKRANLERTKRFFDRYGAKTIILARFVPVVRTFAPFVAGMGSMTYPRFLAYSVLAAVLWVVVCMGAGYFFGGLPVVRENFTIAILALILLSVTPALIEWARHVLKVRRSRRASATRSTVGAEETSG